MIRLHLLLIAGLSAAQWNPNYNRYMAYNAVGYNNGAYPQTDYSGYKGNPDPVPQSFYHPDPPRPEFESNNGYDVIFTVAPAIPVAITNPHPSRISRGSTTPPPPPPSTTTAFPWWEVEETTTTTETPWWLTSPRSTTTQRPTTTTSTQWWTKKTEKPRPTPSWSTIAWWVASSTRASPTTRSTTTETPTTTTQVTTTEAPTTTTEETTTVPETTAIPEEYVTEEYDEYTTEIPSTTTEEPTTTPELIVFKTTQDKDLMKRAYVDFDGFTKSVTTTTESATTASEEEKEERQPEEMIIESVPVTTEVPLPSPPSLHVDTSPLPHPPMLFHSSLEDEFPRPGWVKGEKKQKMEVPVDEQKESEGEDKDVVDTTESSSEMKELYEEVDETLTSTQGTTTEQSTTTESVPVTESTTTEVPSSTTTTAEPVTIPIAVTKIQKMKKKTHKPAPIDNFNGNPLMFGVQKKTSPSTTTTTEATVTSTTTGAPTTTVTEPSTTATSPSSVITHVPSTKSPLPQTTDRVTRTSTTTTEVPSVHVEVSTLPPRPSTVLPTTERTHHHSPRAITFPQTDRPTTHTPSTTKWTTTTTHAPTTTENLDTFPTQSPLVVVPAATRFIVPSTERATHLPTTNPTTVSIPPTTSPSSIESITIPSTTVPPLPPTNPPSTTTSVPPTLIPSLPEDFEFEQIATTTQQASTGEMEASLPLKTPATPPHAVVPRVRVSVDAAHVVNEEPDKEGPLGVSIMRMKKTIKPYAASTTARTITMKPEKKCCPCCAENIENSPSSTARPVRHSVSPTIVSTTFAPIAHTNPPQYVVNFYEQQQIPVRQPPPPSYIPQPPPPFYAAPPLPPPPPPCPCAAQQTKPCCELKPCCRAPVVCAPVPRPCCQPQQQLCCQPNLFEQMMAPARQLFGALGSLYAPPANNCGVCQGSAYRVARVKRTASGCSQCSGRRKRETATEEHIRNKRTAGCVARAARAKRSANGNCADCASINGIFNRQKRNADCVPCNARGKREACPCAAPSPVSHLSPFQRTKREANNKERGYETLLTCDSSCCDFSRCDQVRTFTSKKKVVV